MIKFDNIYKEYKYKLLAIACNLGYAMVEAEDIVHQFYLELMQKNITTEIKDYEAYITTAFKRKLIDIYRITNRKGSIVYIESLELPSTQEIIERLETDEALINRIAEAYKKLPARYRRVIYMKYYQGYSTEKIVTLTGFSHQTIYNNLSKGIQLLRVYFKNDNVLNRVANFIFSIF